MTDPVVIPDRFAVRRRTAASWASVNEVLYLGEIGLERDTGKFKFGDGVRPWNSLPYYGANLWQPLNSNLTEIAGLVDPTADRLLFWDDSAGTNGAFRFLTLGTNLSITGTTLDAAGGGSGSLTALGTATVAGSAATTLTLSGLNLASYKGFIIVMALDNATASNADVSLYYNADTTATNYNRQSLGADGASVSGARANTAQIGTIPASETLTGSIEIANDRDGRPRATSRFNRDAGSVLKFSLFITAWTSATNVTSITLSSSVATSLAVGSTFTVYGLT